MECQPDEELRRRGKERGNQEPFQGEEVSCSQSLGPRRSSTSLVLTAGTQTLSRTENPGQSPQLQEAGIQGPVGDGDSSYLWFAGALGDFLGPLNAIPYDQGPRVSPGHHDT